VLRRRGQFSKKNRGPPTARPGCAAPDVLRKQNPHVVVMKPESVHGGPSRSVAVLPEGAISNTNTGESPSDATAGASQAE